MMLTIFLLNTSENIIIRQEIMMTNDRLVKLPALHRFYFTILQKLNAEIQ